ncbi:MAG TPA: DUF1385 domain-containing protein [Clostridiales bacterium]|nr:DUF1385 domain-containing protein [Clostridiales bacterium]
MKPSGVGGMAVMEGVMMKNQNNYAVAVRKPNNEIVVSKSTHKNLSDKVKLFRLPIFRGMLVFIDSLLVGIKVLNFSASFFDEEEEEKNKKKKSSDKGKKKEQAVKNDEDKDIELDSQKSNALLMALAVILSIGLSIALFMVLPVLISGIFAKLITIHYVLTLLESIIRLAIFIGYVTAASRMKEIKRVFMYHGAEHKTINCIENGFELTLENVRWQSKENKRCGTSFMLFVMVISLFVFIFIPTGNLAWRILTRVLLMPVISGIAYEFIRLAGRKDNLVLNVLSKPGLMMQALTTKEPDDSMIEVAIKSVEAVFDWQGFLAEDTETSNEDEVFELEEITAEFAVTEDEEEETPAPKKKAKVDKKLVAQEVVETEKPEKIEEEKSVKPEKSIKPEKPVKPEKPIKPEKSVQVVKPSTIDDEDDDILKALDKYLD